MEKEVGVAFATVVSLGAEGCFEKKLEIEFALLLDSLDPYGSRKNEMRLMEIFIIVLLTRNPDF